ncbi:MAG: SAM-dependent methyltransferase [Thermoleophilia bacterium]|nr:SAM-dependent methyltransferase [Thermoleophilia bacterium]
MRTAAEVSSERLRGGYYTPPALAHACLDRLAELHAGDGLGAVLEPSCGDGAFLRAIHEHPSHATSVRAVEVDPTEAAVAHASAAALPIPCDVTAGSALATLLDEPGCFDTVVGNPPYVRYQFLSDADRRDVDRVGELVGEPLRRVGNLWLPVLLVALHRLRRGGAFCVVLPAELLTGVSAAAVRRWLTREASDLRIDLFGVGSFPEVLQEVVLLSGRRVASTGPVSVTLVEHRDDRPASWTHEVTPDAANWTDLLLTGEERRAWLAAQSVEGVVALGELATFTVSTITGANAWFCVDDATIAAYGLEHWARPLLPRLRHVPGTVADHAVWDAFRAEGGAAWILDFSAGRDDPTAHCGARRYLATGVDQGIADRYKCRTRAPWYRVPIVEPGTLLMGKRSHHAPRVVHNAAGLVTTDTVYRGQLRDPSVDPHELVRAFGSDLTLLGCEVMGRSFGGGVLELVPSEIAAVPVATAAASSAPELLELAPALASARDRLRTRRLERG